ncbi:uncharacterized protein J7T54_005616 [Emericellopsis cladophorae]|uniref:CCR4-NOT core complex subunit Not4 n=1 Tax=Emericellopsis cladophorae TaxID=2686198 RepID=A0A9Q0BF47_9HYPO|nr:uncharacterized protein J7T54_005616 [Emericellopsis cladophorae]KAI6783587.1 hypothetical protein J7T54_005616 [Emericellopsis cladophorae]
MAPQDSFFDEEVDTCPLCIEEFDLSDRSFRPCPCGYQVCQFCFNNIKNNMNGLCPACRRPYDEKTIEWKVVTSEEVAEFRANIQKNQKKRATEQRQKEVQKREAEKENRKNLVGVRVVQKNLVYITGLAPTVREDELLKTLRKPEFFGQYGNIQKISISNRKSPDGQPQSLGIYVTFERPDEATRCIQAVHGSLNGDRYLKAQYGTTKYCSAWLKNEKCNNPGCMFLHEQGDEEDSYTRQDLSSMNSIATQRPLPSGSVGSSSRAASRAQVSHPTPPPASQSMARSASKEGSDTGGAVDSSALPSTASWARNPQRSRRGSHATSGAAPSPAITSAVPAGAATSKPEEAVVEDSAPPSQSGSQREPSAGPATSSSNESEQPPSEDVYQRYPEGAVRALLKTLASWTMPSFPEPDPTFPPLFDVRGGERRRAMREDEAAMSSEQIDESEVQEASEDEPETGGSLALGGEPEEREPDTKTHAYDHHRTQAQPPIQRTHGDGLFGPALGTPQPGRSMTPQQLFSMRSQAGFGDQPPPGMSFQGQGHNRQSSRFSFANEGGNSSTNVKLAANPRIMAQQSSMMPNSSYQAQGGNHFYGSSSSMPGPPPGLKSTSTPPNMFGQGFGGGAGFGGAPKDSSNELLQSLIGRSRGGANDAAKPPAPGLLGSLYGNPPGAYQDYGSKQQKKKGKKHRHANTSSSGGGGLVDLADPSILQARMQQHQSQSNAGAGPGLFGGQSQDDELPSLDEASHSVDALVSDDTFDRLIQGSRRGTPVLTAPPGFDMRPDDSRLSSAAASPLPKGPPPGLSSIVSTPEQARQKPVTAAPVEAKKNIRSLAADSGLSKAIKTQAQPELSKGALQEEDFPALNAPKTTPSKPLPPQTSASAVSTPKGTPIPKKAKPASKETENHEKPTSLPQAKLSDKKQKADVKSEVRDTKTADTKAAKAAKEVPTPEQKDDAAFPSLPSSSAIAQAAKAGPKTLRLLSTPKSEAPPAVPTVSVVPRVLSHVRPETPTSEMVSDTASMVSASVSASRAGSPPPSNRVGSAAVRSSTKSQQRKQRKEALKQDVAHVVDAPKPVAEVQAPIMGRMKKQKKEKPAKPSKAKAAEPTPTPEKKAPRAPVEEPAKQSPSPVKAPQSKGTEVRVEKKVETPPPIVEQQAVVEDVQEEEKDYGPAAVFQDIKDILWASVAEKLHMLNTVSSSGPRSNKEPAVNTGKELTTPSCKDSVCKCGEIQAADLATLRSGKPVRKHFHYDGIRMLITPNGDCVRGLSEEEEDEFLALQDAIAAGADHPGSFVFQRHQPGNGAFSLIKGRAVPNGRPNIFPATSRSLAHPQSLDPIGKLQREDALSYINQYVLPKLDFGVRTDGMPKRATVRQDAAAASLNSLAPYFYGPDAAAGVGIYSATDGKDFTPASGSAFGQLEDGGPRGPGGPGVSGMPLMSVEDAEAALSSARKETDKLEKKLNNLIKSNRRVLLGGAR